MNITNKELLNMVYRTKLVEIEAIQFTGDNFDEIRDFTNGQAINLNDGKRTTNKVHCIINTLEGFMTAKDGDYIIKGLNGEFYPCKPDIFNKKYELIEEKE